MSELGERKKARKASAARKVPGPTRAALLPPEPLVPVLRAYALGDLAEAMGLREFVVTGLRAGESLHEALRDGESSETAPKMTVDELRALVASL